jgi:hypothetical protein
MKFIGSLIFQPTHRVEKDKKQHKFLLTGTKTINRKLLEYFFVMTSLENATKYFQVVHWYYLENLKKNIDAYSF